MPYLLLASASLCSEYAFRAENFLSLDLKDLKEFVLSRALIQLHVIGTLFCLLEFFMVLLALSLAPLRSLLFPTIM